MCVCVCVLAAQSCLTLSNPTNCSTPGFPALHYLLELLKLMSIESMMPSSHLILCRPLLLLPSVFLSIRVFSSESVLRIRWPKDCSFSFSISPSDEYSGFISFRIDWVGLLAVQRTLKSLLQHHIWKHQTFRRCSKLKEKRDVVALCSTCTYKNLPVLIFSHIFSSLTWIYSAKHLL